jgi:HEPN domain-containing protein
MAKKTPEQIAEENERTSPMGLFHTAEAYWHAAKTLVRSNRRAKRKPAFSEKPAYFCYYHAIELYFKALLRVHHGVDELESKFRHNTTKLMRRAGELSVSFDDEDAEVLGVMGETDAVIRSRYVKTGSFTWPTLEALNRTCKSLRGSVHANLKASGVSLRPIRVPVTHTS